MSCLQWSSWLGWKTQDGFIHSHNSVCGLLPGAPLFSPCQCFSVGENGFLSGSLSRVSQDTIVEAAKPFNA